MGLDMYLERRSYVQQWKHIPPAQQFAVTVTRGGNPWQKIKSERVSYVVEGIAYWRKANAIHRWFVANVQDGKDDCGHYYVPVEKLTELLALSKRALRCPSKAAEILPTQSGFFFGDTAYGEGYREDLNETIRQLDAILAEDNSETDFYYHSSW